MAIISPLIYPYSSKLSVVVPQLANHLSIVYTFQSSSTQEPQIQAKVQVLKFYKKYLEKKFLDLFVEVSTSRIIELLTKYSSHIEVDLLITAISKK